MKMHGLGDASYLLVTYLWYICVYLAYMFVFCLFGSLIGLQMFTLNDYGEGDLRMNSSVQQLDSSMTYLGICVD